MSDRLDRSIWPIAAVASLGPLITNLDTTIVNVSLPALGRDLHAPLALSQWVVTAYLLALALMLPLSGWLVDRVGAKRVYLGCFALFTLASILCGIAPSIDALIAARILQGIAGGLLAPMAQMMVARYAPNHIARVMGIVVVPVLLGPIFGPSLAGFTLQHASWRWVFLINLPVGVVALALAAALLPRDAETTQPRPLDIAGLALLSPSLVLLLYGLERVANAPGPAPLAEILVASAMLAAYVRHAARRGNAALLDLALFRDRSFATASTTLFLANGTMLGGSLLLPLDLLDVWHLTPERTGLLLAATGIGALCAFPLMGRLTEHVGGRRICLTGGLVTLAGTLPFALAPAAQWPQWTVAALLFLRGAGLGAIAVPMLAAGYRSIPHAGIPAATAALNIVQRLGGPSATTALAVVLHGRAGFAGAFWLLCAIHAAVIVAAARLPAREPARRAGVARA